MTMLKAIPTAACVLIAAASMPSPALAGVVTLNFEARVSSLFGEWHATEYHEAPPIIVQVDDVITGSLTFDPAIPFNSTTDWSPPLGIQTNVGGRELFTDETYGYVMDDRRTNSWICDCAYGGPVLPPFEITSGAMYDDPADPIVDDRIEIGTGLYTTVNSYRVPRMVPGNSNWHWQTALSFSGPTSVLGIDNFLPSQVNVWERFTNKTLRFGIATGVQVGVTATAQITSLTLVPEPSTLALAAMASASLAVARPCRAGRQNQTTTELRRLTS